MATQKNFAFVEFETHVNVSPFLRGHNSYPFFFKPEDMAAKSVVEMNNKLVKKRQYHASQQNFCYLRFHNEKVVNFASKTQKKKRKCRKKGLFYVWSFVKGIFTKKNSHFGWKQDTFLLMSFKLKQVKRNSVHCCSISLSLSPPSFRKFLTPSVGHLSEMTPLKGVLYNTSFKKNTQQLTRSF